MFDCWTNRTPIERLGSIGFDWFLVRFRSISYAGTRGSRSFVCSFSSLSWSVHIGGCIDKRPRPVLSGTGVRLMRGAKGVCWFLLVYFFIVGGWLLSRWTYWSVVLSLACVQTPPLSQKKNREKSLFSRIFLREGGRVYTGYVKFCVRLVGEKHQHKHRPTIPILSKWIIFTIDKVNNERDLLDKERQWAYRLGCIRPHCLNDSDFFYSQNKRARVQSKWWIERSFSVISARPCRSLSRYSM